MPTTQTEFRQRLEELVRKFQANAAEYLSSDYAEAQARRHFIDPLFDALGWDFQDRAGLGPSRCEVWMEKGETTGKPDYNFRINAQTKFFAEAKAPHVKLSGPHILQAKRYAWNHADVSFAVLTDFEEFRLYDATLKPDPEHPDLGLIFQYRYDEYRTDAALADLWKLSRDEVAAGSLDKLLKQDAASRRMRVPVDKAFLADLTQWREMLAKDAFRHNSDLDVRALNEAVQVMLDRLIFCRIAEDRRIIQADTLKKLVERWSEGKHRSLRAMLNTLFETINEDLNGEVFKPNAALDEAAFDDALTARIIHGLTDGPYDFAVIGVELLGSIYERYLGKTIRVTAKRAIVEDKPEVRKAGGVYYTPKYIVDYIVEQTVGKLIEGKTPAQIAKLRIADPACGSGSFLLAAYQKLIDYHVAYYSEHPKEARQDQLWADLIDADPVGGLPAGKRLSILKKGEILTNNLFGVDLDPQAVEITMMSLYVKALEGETTLPHKRGLLPTLANNIKCGNSLIGPDYFEGQLMPDAEEWERVKPFDWKAEFPLTPSPSPSGRGERGEGGFDCVIGNPPYIRIQTMKEWTPLEVELYKQHYAAASKGNYDIYAVFVERSLSLLNKHGRLGFILPHKFFNAQYGEPLRALIAKGKHLAHVVHFGDQQVFDGATTYTCLLFLDKTGSKECRFAKVDDLTAWRETRQATEGEVPAKSVTAAEWNFTVGKGAALFERLSEMSLRLGDIAHIFVGLQTSADPVFILKVCSWGDKKLRVYSKAIDKEFNIERGIVKQLLKGAEIHAYYLDTPENVILFPYHIESNTVVLIDETELRKTYPLAWQYLLETRKLLEARDGGKWRVPQWWQFGRNQNIAEMNKRKLLTQVLAKHASLTLDTNAEYCFVGGGNAGGYGVQVSPPSELSDCYVLGLINSRLLDWYLKKISTPFRGGFYSFARRFIEQLPIRPINFSDPADVARHDRMVSLVERMLELRKRLASARASADREMYQRQTARPVLLGVEATDRQIDALVYELYGLTEEEIKIVEAA